MGRAPKDLKRAAWKAALGASEKAAKKHCAEVVSAINTADLSESCTEMVAQIAKNSLTVYAAERHPYQAQGIKMVGETLFGVKKNLEATVAEQQAKVDQEDGEKVSRATATEAAQNKLADLEQKNTEAKQAVSSSKDRLTAAQAHLTTCGGDLQNNESELKNLNTQKEKTESTMASAYGPLKEAGAKGADGRKQINALEAVLKEIGLELGLVEMVPDTLRKAPGSRGTFDGLVQQHVEAGTDKFVTETGKAVVAAEEAKPKLAEAQAAAEAAVTEAQQQVSGSILTHGEAEEAMKKCQAEIKAAQAAVTSFGKESAAAVKNLESAKAALASFNDGALAAFGALESLAPPPEPVIEEPAAPAEEAPAAAEEVLAAD